MSTDNTRVPATIVDVFYGKEDHGILTCYITLTFKSGGTQAFGGLRLEEVSGKDFCRRVCDIFNVSSLNDLINKSCYGLFCFGDYNEMIEGIESPNGKRFTLTTFSKIYDTQAQTPLERRQKSLEQEIERAQQTIIDNKRVLVSLKKRYTNWG